MGNSITIYKLYDSIPSTDNDNTNVMEQDVITTWVQVSEFRQVYLLHHRNVEALSLLQEYPD